MQTVFNPKTGERKVVLTNRERAALAFVQALCEQLAVDADAPASYAAGVAAVELDVITDVFPVDGQQPDDADDEEEDAELADPALAHQVGEGE